MQYLGLALTVVAWGIMFVPLLYVADLHAPGVIANAAIVTLVGFSGLTAIVFITRKDFSFLRGLLMWATFAALGFIVIGSFAGWNGGTVFPVLMIALAGGWVLHDTSNVLLHYPEDRYVGASLELFGSIALMFWYVLQLFLSRE
jgi:FtsH-binding integral membrane protein